MPPSVSIVIATYNYGRYLAGCLDSLRAQTVADWEAIVVDDGSTDNTMDVSHPYLSDVRIRLHRSDHVGQPAAKNLGIRLAQAPLIAFLDADDSWYPTKLERQLALFDNNPELGVAFTRRLLMDEQGRLMPSWQPECHRGHVLHELFRDNFIAFSTSMVRRTVFDKVGLFDERIPLAIDWELWLRIAKHFTFDFVDEPLVLYRTGHANLSRRLEERCHVVLGIRRRFLEQQGGAALFTPATIRRRLAGTKANIGLTARERSRLASITWCIRAILTHPGCRPAWRGLAMACLPDRVLQLLRTALRRSALG